MEKPTTFEELAERETNELSAKFFTHLENWRKSFPNDKETLNGMEVIDVLQEFYNRGIVDGINTIMCDLPIAKEIDDGKTTSTLSAT